ncbi:MAG: malate:quinone oxidoreductase [Vulcanimicrobiaceae bacterium]
MMIGVLEGAFKTELPGWKAKLTEMIPSYGRSIAEDAALCTSVRAETAATLGLKMSLSPSAVVVTPRSSRWGL